MEDKNKRDKRSTKNMEDKSMEDKNKRRWGRREELTPDLPGAMRPCLPFPHEQTNGRIP